MYEKLRIQCIFFQKKTEKNADEPILLDNYLFNYGIGVLTRCRNIGGRDATYKALGTVRNITYSTQTNYLSKLRA
jgi:hypothetical protein